MLQSRRPTTSTPAVSIIIPARNMAPWIGTTLQSVINQSLDDWECIVIDDGSADNTAEHVAACQDRRIRLVAQAQTGVSAARNTGLGLAKGTVLAFLDADDIWQPKALEIMAGPLLCDQGCALVWADFIRFEDGSGRMLPLPGTRLWRTGDAWLDLLVDNFMQFGALCVQASVARQYLFDVSLRIGEDRDWLLRVLRGRKAVHIAQVVHYYRQRTNSAVRDIAHFMEAEEKMLLPHLCAPDVPPRIRRRALSALAFHQAALLAKLPDRRWESALRFGLALARDPLYCENYLRPLRKIYQKLHTGRVVPLPTEKILPETPTISLLVATLNRQKSLQQLLDSLSQQTCQNFEVLVADQNPPGFLDDLLGRYSSHFALRVFSLPSRGVSYARNALLPHAQGDIVAFPDDDCCYAPHTLAAVCAHFKGRPSALGLLAAWSDASNQPQPQTAPHISSVSPYTAFHSSETYSQFYRRAALSDIAFDEHLGPGTNLPYGCGEDTDLVLQIIAKGRLVERTNQILVFHPKVDYADPGLTQKTKAYALGRMFLLRKHGFSLFFTLCHIAYPLLRLLLEGPRAAKYRSTMFLWRLRGFFHVRKNGT